MCRKDSVPRKKRRTRTTIRGLTTGDSSGPKDPLELVRRRDLELVVAAVARRFVRAPAHELRGMPEPIALHMVVRDLHHALGPQRLPSQILAAVPAAGCSG